MLLKSRLETFFKHLRGEAIESSLNVSYHPNVEIIELTLILFRYEQIPQNTATYIARLAHRWYVVVVGAALTFTPFFVLAMLVVV